jgi:sterol desaturase/sphingolipid hydroxylase (fatty acid hydroxylase superfamily)
MSRVLPFVWYPAFLALALAAFFALLAHGAAPALAAYAPVIGVGVSILLLETRFAEREDWRPTRADVAADAAFMAVVMVALPRLLAVIAVLALADWRHAEAAGPWPHDWPLAAQIVLAVLAVDFARYWLHRACHRFTPLWRLHEVHHSPDILYVANVGRFHPVEKVLHFTLDTLPFLALGVAPEVLAGYFLLYSVNGFFQHSNLKLRYGWLNYLVGSAETHRWHHARDPKLAACNFGNTTIVWDVMFGTWRLPGRVGEVGIPDRAYPQGFLAQMTAPFRHVAIALGLRIAEFAARRRLAAAMRDPMRAQHELLARILRANRGTEFGRQHRFGRIRSYRDFASHVPVSDFERLRPAIESEIERGGAALTREPPLRYVRTSGTTGRAKDIPLTASHLEMLRQIHRDSVAFQHRACPAAFEGSIVAMVSPAFEGALANGKPYGSASGIVAGNTSAALQGKFAVPAPVLTIADSRVKYLLALRLAIARGDVTYLGAANPTTLLTLARLYREHQADLVADLRRGGFFLADRVPADVLKAVSARLAPDAARAGQLASLRSPRIAELWPSLRLVVTWTCASAGIAVDTLRRELSPSTRILELGYVSSEFRGTITVGKRAGSGLPTHRAHFFEFVERRRWDRGEKRPLLLDQLEKGREYYPIVTTPSGLYRYFINDVVEVTGFLGRMPLLRFVQKGKGVTNITGEKLCEAQVLEAVRSAMAAIGRDARFVMALADEEESAYRLYVETDAGPRPRADELASRVDACLARLNVEYQAKRESERLGALRAFWVAPQTGEAYKAHCVTRGQREGQFKMVALDYRKRFGYDLDAHAEAA